MLALLFGIGKKRDDHQTDEELVSLYRSTHNNHYVGVLYKRYTQLIYGVCVKYLRDGEAANDAVMEIFEKLLDELQKHEVQQFKPWLYTMAKNYCLMQLRKQKTADKKEDGYVNFLQDIMEDGDNPHLDNTSEKEKLFERLEIAMQQLKEEQKVCVRLYYFEDKSYKEIEGMLGMDDKQVKSHLQNGKRNLKLLLTRTDE